MTRHRTFNSFLIFALSVLIPVAAVAQEPPPLPAPAETPADVPSEQPVPKPPPLRSPQLMPASPKQVFIPAIPRRRPGLVGEYSLIYIEEAPPPEIAINDIITILVNHSAVLNSNSRFNRQKNESFTAELVEFLTIDWDNWSLENSASTAPAIDASLQNRIQNVGQLQDSEGLNFRIAATVQDVLPNGNLVIEARKIVRTSDDEWEYRLSGIIPSSKVNKDMTALAEDIADTRLERYQKGRIYDSTKRGWGTKLVDWLFPF